MPTVYILIGPPGSGKSTWRAANEGEARVVSTDDLIDRIAEERGLSYSEVFPTLDMKELESQAREEMATAISWNEDFIIDRTNMSKKSRGRYLSNVPKRYHKVAVDFTRLDRVELNERLDRRAQVTGKSIPRDVIDDMINRYEPPTEDEFDEIIWVN